ncbi:MAG TPA: peptidoglycan editing factor PgeF [Chryseolinea sp.]|nr:peptidoglycan editing factor PgeF [Chryseolinea sp.]HPM29049.1 peptidoglycan editing factor PgeF [Chryseolinea sp.]
MNKSLVKNLHLWQFDSLANDPSVKHFVTDRKSGKGEKEFNLSYSSVPDRNEVHQNRMMLADAMGINESCLYFPSQVHKTKIVNVKRSTSKYDVLETDALITDVKGICIAVMSADCVPILLYDFKNKAVGAVHSGWRGTVAKILEKTLQEMKLKFGTEGKDLVACIGPSVCQDSYEVGEEVVMEVTKAFGYESGLMVTQPNNKAKLDLWLANKIQLLEFGVDASRIEVSDLCSVKNNSHFFSARKGDGGRYAAGIMLTD